MDNNAKKIKDMYDLRDAYYKMYPDGHFFDKETLKAFGERFSEMRLLSGTVKMQDSMGVEHECYVVSCTQLIPFQGRKRVHHYFDVSTFEYIEYQRSV